ncbi:uncharacterized protein LOC110846894 [Folsomia candida]|uniref:uncharacterized protein LOC110846894 n=1 Tax=Folsomia candida TaxID=158441 RepID=UPI001604F0B9|nr:uncharacterized protein LOC110846894 [Folsomia candida]
MMGELQLKRVGNVPSFVIARAILGSLCIHWGMLMVVGLRLENVTIPRSGSVGGSVTLGCDYHLESNDTLLSLKFYRDEDEFFRFFPGNKESPIAIFNQPGIHVDLGESFKVLQNRVKFRLKNLDFSSGGTYRCEISADSPSFRTLHMERNLSIIALPEFPKPVLSGFPAIAQYGDKISSNCTFADSFPSAEITLYLNNNKVTNSDDVELIHYKPLQLGRRLTTIVGAKFRISPKHFQSRVLQIRCEARLFDQKWETLVNITHQNNQAPFHTAGQNRYYGGGGCCLISLPRIVITLLTTTLLHTCQTDVFSCFSS